MGDGDFSVWDKNEKAISLGDILSVAYRTQIDAAGLLELAKEADKAKGESGGAGKTETDEHFAWRFANSAGRGIFVSIDPECELSDVSDKVKNSFLDGEVVLVDVPCGCGGGVFGLLASIVDQRKSGTIPILPLRVRLIAGDFSQHAREHLRAIFLLIEPELASYQIRITLEEVHWDATDLTSSARLIDQVIASAGSADRIFLSVSNFSQALKNDELKYDFELFLAQFASRISIFPNLIFWIEPPTGDAKSLLQYFRSWFFNTFKWKGRPEPSEYMKCSYRMIDPFTGSIYQTGVSVLKCESGGLPW